MGQNLLGRGLGMDKTTLSRNLIHLHRRGWVRIAQDGRDRRARTVHLTPGGKRILKRAQPLWKRVQEDLRSTLAGGVPLLRLAHRAGEAACKLAVSETAREQARGEADGEAS